MSGSSVTGTTVGATDSFQTKEKVSVNTEDEPFLGVLSMNLWQDFKTNDGKIVHKWMHYFPIYEKHLSCWRNKTVTFLEIGVAKGGSLQMWSRFLGPLATIIGIDIDPECLRHQEDGI